MEIIETGPDNQTQSERHSGTIPQITRCSICTEPAKYRCPQCAVRTCSLVCVKEHKIQTGCDGIRDKTAFVSMEKFDNIALLSDYRYLEDVGRKTDNLKRSKDIISPPNERHYDAGCLRKACRRNRTKLRLMPGMFTRHKENTSYYDFEEKTIYWHIEWNFVDVDTSYTSPELISEHTSLHECMDTMLETCSIRHKHTLTPYINDGSTSWKFLLNPPRSNGKQQMLKGDRTLRYNLAGKVLIEYPVITVKLNDKLVESGDVKSEKNTEQSIAEVTEPSVTEPSVTEQSATEVTEPSVKEVTEQSGSETKEQNIPELITIDST